MDGPISLPLKAFCGLHRLGVTKTREMLKTGELQAFRVGRNVHILLRSYHEYIERQLRDGMPDYTKTKAAVSARRNIRQYRRGHKEKQQDAVRRAEKSAAVTLEDLGL
jgi:hypothetical protein